MDRMHDTDGYRPNGAGDRDPERYGPDYVPYEHQWRGAPVLLDHAEPAPSSVVPAAQRRGSRTRSVLALVAVAAMLVGAGITAGRMLQGSGIGTNAAAAAPSTRLPGSQLPGSKPPGSQLPGSQPPGSQLPGSQSPGSQLPATPGGRAHGSTQYGAGAQKSTATSAAGKQATATIAPALVDITTTIGYGQGEAAGTGIVLTADGTVLTNHHVVAGATTITARDIGNGQTYQASVVGYDDTHDIAVLKLVDASGLQTATLDQNGVQVGDGIVGVGNAQGLGGTPSASEGTVTALDREITVQSDSGGAAEHLTGLIQTNAAIEPGDSGGALVDLQGEVVGVDTAASSANTTGQGAIEGYAIPIGQATTIAGQITAGQSSSTVHIGGTPFLGVDMSSGVAGYQTVKGAAIVGVVPGTAAAQLGLAGGDVITEVNGRKVSSAAELATLLHATKIGDTITLTWYDGFGTPHSGSATLSAGPVG